VGRPPRPPSPGPGNRRRTGEHPAVTSDAPWAVFQRAHAGPHEVLPRGGDTEIWADGLHVDPDTVVSVEAKDIAEAGGATGKDLRLRPHPQVHSVTVGASVAMADEQFRADIVNHTEQTLAHLQSTTYLPEGFRPRFYDNTPETLNVVLLPRAGDASAKPPALRNLLRSRTSHDGVPVRSAIPHSPWQ
jgi:hypothetical protein